MPVRFLIYLAQEYQLLVESADRSLPWINYGHNEHLMQGCGMLSQYAQFVAVTREYANKYDNREEAMNAAIEYCIGHGILEDILRKHRNQVLGSLLEEFDEKKYVRTLREEGYFVSCIIKIPKCRTQSSWWERVRQAL